MSKTSLGHKKTQQLNRTQLKEALAVATNKARGDLLIKNVKLLDLVNGDTLETHIMIKGETIVGVGPEYADQEAERIFDANGLYAVPGFIDGHLHIESSLMNPFEFERLTLPLGTTTAICDPHEITNVLGEKGFSWFLRASEFMQQNLFVQVSSCVPALPGQETNGGTFALDQMKQFKDHPNVLGLAEMMNFPGVIHGDDEVLDKIDEFSDLNLDGHCPLVQGRELDAYLIAGIQNCHETVTVDEGREKLQKGMALIIREGSVAKNLKTLAPLVTEFNSPQCFLCTDDRNPYEIFNEGHINYLIKKMINEVGVAPHVAYRLASFSAAKHFGLKRLGLLAPGKKADIVLLSSLEDVAIETVFIGGLEAKSLNLESQVSGKLTKSNPPLENTIVRKPLAPAAFSFPKTKGIYNVIEIIPDEIITNHLTLEFDGTQFIEKDVLKLAVIERYGNEREPALGFVKGLGLTRGAIASTVAHDSHNIIVIGASVEEMTLAVNTLIENAGGFCVVEGDQILAVLELPIAGLISLDSAEVITEKIIKLRKSFKSLGVVLEEPFLQMAFLALPVIPTLKITDRGLFDAKNFQPISLEARQLTSSTC
jgi:adenine deaminase